MSLNIEIRNFKSIRSTSLHLREGLNMLVGPNGSGKTCLLSALKFLRDMLRVGAAEALAKSGGAKRVYHRGQSKIRFAVSQDYGLRNFRRRKRPFDLLWEVEIAQRGPEKIATIVLESLTISAKIEDTRYPVLYIRVEREGPKLAHRKVRLARRKDFGIDLFCHWVGRPSTRRKSDILAHLLPRIRGWMDEAKKDGDTAVLRVLSGLDFQIESLYGKFGSLDEYSILPNVARKPTEQLQFARMGPDGGAVSEVIHALQNKHFHKIISFRHRDIRKYFYYAPGEYSPIYGDIWHEQRYAYQRRKYPKEVASILDNINKELAAGVRAIDGVSVEVEQTTGRRGVVFKVGDEKFYPEEVSDGTMKWLCILVSIFVGHSGVYLLEEPENFLHPWMQQRMISIMRRDSRQSGTIFVLTSHSSTILNAAKPVEVLVVRHSGKGTEVSEIAERKEIERVLAESDFRLGDLWVSGAIGGIPVDE